MGNKRVWTDEEIIFVLTCYLDGLSNDKIRPLFQAKFGVAATSNDIRYAMSQYPDSPDYGAVRSTNMTGFKQKEWGIEPAVYDFTPTVGHRMQSAAPRVRISERKPKSSNRDREYLNGLDGNTEKQHQQEDRVLLHHLDCHAFLKNERQYVPWDDNVIRAATKELLDLEGHLAYQAKGQKRWKKPIVIPDDDDNNTGSSSAQTQTRKRSRKSFEAEESFGNSHDQGNPSKRARSSTCNRCCATQPTMVPMWTYPESSYPLMGQATSTAITDLTELNLPPPMWRGLTPSPTDTNNTVGSFDLNHNWSATPVDASQPFDANQFTFDPNLFNFSPVVPPLPEPTVDTDPVKSDEATLEPIASEEDFTGLEWMNNLEADFQIDDFLALPQSPLDNAEVLETETIKLLQENLPPVDAGLDRQSLTDFFSSTLCPEPAGFDPLSPSRVFDDDYEPPAI